MPADHPLLANSLLRCIRALGQQGWCPATGGNFSARIDDELRLITQSGRDKRHAELSDLMLCDTQGKPLSSHCKPSDETALHMRLYQLSDDIGAVLHTHSVPATVLSRTTRDSHLSIQGYEMQKALKGQSTHEQTLRLPVFDNTQDIDALADEVEAAWQAGTITAPALLVRGHGLYAWGQNLAQAQKHVEGVEFLLNCLLQERLLGPSC